MIKVLVVEDHPQYGQSLCLTLNNTKGFTCSGRFPAIESAVLSKVIPDVILVDINLPGMNGIDGIPKLKECFPEAAILMLTVYDTNEYVFKSILAGADGYLLKTTEPKKLLNAIEDAYAGGCPMSPTVARETMNYFRKTFQVIPKDSILTDREKEILQLIIDGFNNDEISKKLFISIQTVRNHIRHIYEKLHVHSKSQAVVKAIKENLL